MTPEFLPHYHCDNCGELVSAHDCIIVTKNVAQNQEITLHFCGEKCSQDFYMQRLRKDGL